MISEALFSKFVKKYKKNLLEQFPALKCRLPRELSQIKSNVHRYYSAQTDPVQYSTHVTRFISITWHEFGTFGLYATISTSEEKKAYVNILLQTLVELKIHALVYLNDAFKNWYATPGSASSVLRLITSFPMFHLSFNGSIRLQNPRFDYELHGLYLDYHIVLHLNEGAISFERKKTFKDDPTIVYHRFESRESIDQFLVENWMRHTQAKKAKHEVEHFLIYDLKIPRKFDDHYFDFLDENLWIHILRSLNYQVNKEEFLFIFKGEHRRFENINETISAMKETYKNYYMKNRLRYLTGGLSRQSS